MLHATAMLLMIVSAITAAACCLVAGGVLPRAVPWQARQSAVAMALGMVALCAGARDAGVLLLVVAGGIGSAMLGVVGTRGRAHAAACFHRALGCVVMAVCALALLGAGAAGAAVAAPAAHAGHGTIVPMSFAAAAGVVVLVGLMLAARVRHRRGPGGVGAMSGGGTGGVRGTGGARSPGGAGAAAIGLRRGARGGRILLEAEGVAMAVSLIVMAAMVLVP